MAGIELVWLNWGHQGLERNSYTKKLEESFIAGEPDAGGGVSVKVSFYNASEKDIKYVTFGFVAYNAVNDMIACDISNKKLIHEKFTGPLASNEETKVLFERIWFNKTVDKVVIHEVTVEYMDGTTETVAGKDLVRIYDYSKPTKYSYEYNHNSVYYKKVGKEREEREKRREEMERAKWAKKQEEQAKRAKKTKMVYTIIGIIIAVILVVSVIPSFL